MAEINIKKLMGQTKVKKSVLESIEPTIIRDKYRMSLGELISLDVNTGIAQVNIYDDDTKSFTKALKRYIYERCSELANSEYKRNALKAAMDFGYGQDVIQEIEATNDDVKINNIMKRARDKKFK